MKAEKSPIKTYDRIATGLMLVCAAGFVFGALYALGF